jgi:hypothetical protein
MNSLITNIVDYGNDNHSINGEYWFANNEVNKIELDSYADYSEVLNFVGNSYRGIIRYIGKICIFFNTTEMIGVYYVELYRRILVLYCSNPNIPLNDNCQEEKEWEDLALEDACDNCYSERFKEYITEEDFEIIYNKLVEEYNEQNSARIRQVECMGELENVEDNEVVNF